LSYVTFLLLGERHLPPTILTYVIKSTNAYE
jgi:hypothetical protein